MGNWYVFCDKSRKAKKKHNIKTYKEIIAFSEGNSNLEELQKKRSNRKYLIEKVLIVLAFTLTCSAIALIIGFITNIFMKL